MIDLSLLGGRPVAVMGLGKSGLATAMMLGRCGVEVRAWDDDAASRERARAAGVPIVDLSAADLHDAAMLVLSPGIPHTHPAPHPVVERARAAGLKIICDIDVLVRAQHDSTYIGITGTNGKSTTTALIGHILSRAGRRIAVGGNLGTPVLTLDPMGPGGTYVIEMSSYQLELTPSAAWSVAVLLNISPDHLSRHGGMGGYVAAKQSIFDIRTGAGALARTAVIGVDDAWCRSIHAALADAGTHTVIPVSGEGPVSGGVYALDGVLIDDTQGAATPVLDLATAPALPGRHNWQNAAAAYAAARAVGLAPELIAQELRDFPGLAHRQQLVGIRDGIRYVNDSKATNADAAAKALACYDAIYWIVGGRAKENGLDGLEPFMPRIRHAFLVGEASDRFARWLDGKAPYSHAGTVRDAVAMATAAARSGGDADPVVLLSPAAASWDQFRDFEHRGLVFTAAVAALGSTGTGSSEPEMPA